MEALTSRHALENYAAKLKAAGITIPVHTVLLVKLSTSEFLSIVPVNQMAEGTDSVIYHSYSGPKFVLKRV